MMTMIIYVSHKVLLYLVTVYAHMQYYHASCLALSYSHSTKISSSFHIQNLI